MAKKGKHRRYTKARELKQAADEGSFVADDAVCPECSMRISAGHKQWCEYGS